MDWIDGPPDWAGLGASMARAHRTEGPGFGWERDNLIGPLDQANGWSESWGDFYTRHRVLAHLDDPAVPATLGDRLRTACDGPLPALLEAHDPVPSLIHGDLWSGNIVAGRAVIDPAVCHADREVDLAFLAFFGGAPAAFDEGYASEWPLADGWERRRPALQLHHALVHIRLFGVPYVHRVEAILDSLGW